MFWNDKNVESEWWVAKTKEERDKCASKNDWFASELTDDARAT